MSDRPPGTLFLVSTPIGNLGDISHRAVEILGSVGLILAEDTRHTRGLLERYAVRTPTISYHEHNEAHVTPQLVARLVAGETFALVSDAGTPLLSDPGHRLVTEAIAAGVTVSAIPGASALLAALVASGLPAIPFTFHGFLSRAAGERRAQLERLLEATQTSILYESANRLISLLSELEAAGAADRQGAVARELTKQFEDIQRGTVTELRQYYMEHPPRGEIVIVIARAPIHAATDDEIRARVRELRAAGASARDAASTVARELGVSRRVAYQMTQEQG